MGEDWLNDGELGVVDAWVLKLFVDGIGLEGWVGGNSRYKATTRHSLSLHSYSTRVKATTTKSLLNNVSYIQCSQISYPTIVIKNSITSSVERPKI